MRELDNHVHVAVRLEIPSRYGAEEAELSDAELVQLAPMQPQHLDDLFAGLRTARSTSIVVHRASHTP
jgi:hypothetical protein